MQALTKAINENQINGSRQQEQQETQQAQGKVTSELFTEVKIGF